MQRTTRPSALLAVLALVLTAWLAGDTTTPTPTPTNDMTLVAGGHHVDNTSKAAVRRAFRNRWAPTLEVPTRWSGSYAGCRAGAVSRKSRRATRKALNFTRALGGLDPVRFTRSENRRAQDAALVMGANQSLSHDPLRSWRCWTASGYLAAQTSNLALRWPSIPSGRAIDQYMVDAGDTNRAVAHRRWILNPATAVMGTGSTDIANALVVVTTPQTGRATPRWIGWPTAGWFPNQMEPRGRWSLSSTDPAHDFSQARVRVRVVGGSRLAVRRHTPEIGAGPNTLVWEVRPRANRAHRVVVSNIQVRGRATTIRRRYVVRLFDAR